MRNVTLKVSRVILYNILNGALRPWPRCGLYQTFGKWFLYFDINDSKLMFDMRIDEKADLI